jgi:hypothetical protein
MRKLAPDALSGTSLPSAGDGAPVDTICEVLVKSLAEVQVMLEGHRCFQDCVKEEGGILHLCPCFPSCPYRQILKETLLETIQELEKSRRAFKSKQIEALRKKLMAVLAEAV